LGDLMLDEYVVGRATRLSREAPVPVLERTRSFTVLGGACNPAHNIRALGSVAIMVGVIGQDAAGKRLLDALRAAGVDEAGVVVDSSRPTTTKTRLVAESALRVPQHLARIDHLDRRLLDPTVEGQLLEQLEALAPGCDAILVSHYRNGVVTQAVTDRVRQMARQHGALATVDAQANLATFAGFHLIKCNRGEAETELGHGLVDDADFERALVRLLPRLGVANLVITRGADGMSALEQGQSAVHNAAMQVSDIYDVVGAGDTVIAVLTLALAAGLSLATACHLANAAAGLVVRRLGNAIVQPDELTRFLEEGHFV
jgi:rfaE bifunctional protein kinase chain/domain